MDVHLQANPQLYYGVNGQNSRPGEDPLLFLSQEEQECLQFFEKTIDSLEESLVEDERRPGQVRIPASSGQPVEEIPSTSSPKPGIIMSSFQAKDQDIIDLVQPEPDLVQTKEQIFIPTSPDFQTMMQNPDSHFEIKPRRDQIDNLPSEYNPPLPSGYGSTDSHSSYHPPGCIPTPVLIAQQIAENQAGGPSNFNPSSNLRRSSLDSQRPLGYSADLHGKHGPPTSAKPTRFPANISVIHGGKDHQNQPLANVNIHERRAQMLANLSGTSHPLLQEDPQQAVEQKPRNIPTRSVSFRDPTPDKSRMEALSKLGLNRNRAMSGGTSLLGITDNNSLEPLKGGETSAKPLKASGPPTTDTSTKMPEARVMTPSQSQIHVDRKPEILRTDSLRSHEDRNPKPTSFPPPPEVTLLELNSYGGKSIVVNPSVSSRSEPATYPSSHEPKILPPALANPSEFNPYGGKTKVMNAAPVPVTRSDLPDILSSHIDKSQTLPAKSEPPSADLRSNSYGGKSLTINSSTGLNYASHTPARTFKAPAPTPAPRPSRHSDHGAVTAQKPASRALSPEHKRRPSYMFRPQGITVQFSGRGATDESRREALRKLGLLKES
ncbi:specifically androgen-regulated gene protein [Scomber scombrus]|uniref:specifically androgen-regulated gene protein n=1 Tax=Scomber scombrus TaxID=13677 RepID=UPI002DDBF03F|nr:specifically androgen-regulated gene protein [Scomber scombrus]